LIKGGRGGKGKSRKKPFGRWVGKERNKMSDVGPEPFESNNQNSKKRGEKKKERERGTRDMRITFFLYVIFGGGHRNKRNASKG